MLGERDQVATIVRESALPHENLVQTLALGILVLSKHDFAEEKHGVNFTNNHLAQADAFTPAEIARFQEQANRMLTQFAVMVATSEPRATLLEALTDWLWGFGQAYAGAVAWSITLLAIALMVRYGGGDLVDIFSKWITPAGH